MNRFAEETTKQLLRDPNSMDSMIKLGMTEQLLQKRDSTSSEAAVDSFYNFLTFNYFNLLLHSIRIIISYVNVNIN